MHKHTLEKHIERNWKIVAESEVPEEAVIRTDNNWSNVSIIYVFRKIKHRENE